MPHRTERSRSWTSRLKCSPNDLHLRPLAVQVDVCFDFASDIWRQIGVNSLSSLFHAVIIFNTLLVPWNTPIIYRPCLSIFPHINALRTVIHRDPHLHFPFLLWDSKEITLHHLLLIHLLKVCACVHLAQKSRFRTSISSGLDNLYRDAPSLSPCA